MSNYSPKAETPAPNAEQTGGRTPGSNYYLPEGLPVPVINPDDLYGPFWQGARDEKLQVQQNPATGSYQWPPQWIAHDTQSFDLEWVDVEPRGVIYSWTRVWHPVHPVLKDAGPYIIVIVELPHAGGIRMLGNLLGDPHQVVQIGSAVEAVFEHHNDAAAPFTLIQWRPVTASEL
ncbi:Zn-ribbon domain-containing OB-fold protein [Parasphingorhabdus sp.]|uniref:Zn-ribbon domain-containing OB-fold protein n=1 Tax=Parasphingorhabdus sp. TaxID=2709688 RepID=UPI002F91E55A